MDTTQSRFLSPLYLSLLFANVLCLGGLFTLVALRLASGQTSIPLVLATIGSGLMTTSLGVGALVAARKRKNCTRLS
ncbi:hypothetical protein HS125_13540 [bacterium]|nr:hypothetical protein [bacterium]